MSRGFYLALRKNPALTIPEFLNDEETFYKVACAESSAFRFAKALSVDGSRRQTKRRNRRGKFRSPAPVCL